MRRVIHYLIPLFRYAQHHLTGAAISLTKKPPERVAWIDGYGFVLGLSVRPRM